MEKKMRFRAAFQQSAWRKGACFLLAILSAAAMGINFENTMEADAGIVYGVLASFQGWGISELLITVMLFCLYLHVNQSFAIRKWTAFFSAFLASLMLLGLCYTNATGIALALLNGTQIVKTGIVLIGYGAIFYCAVLYLGIWLGKSAGDGSAETDSGRSRVKTCAILFLCWLPYLIICYPGTTLYDARTMLEQYFGLAELTNHHPYFQILLLGVFVKAGDALGSGAAGMFVYVLLQEWAFIFVLSYMLERMREFGVSGKIRKIVFWLYALLPVFPVYAISVGKNMNFSIVVLLLTVFLFELMESGESFVRSRGKMALLPVLLVLLCLFRNEGIWIVAGCLPAFLWAGRKRWKTFLGIFAGVILFAGLWFRCALPAFQVEDGSIAESLSIPFLQTARTVAYYGDEITEEERQAIDAVLEYDTLPERYLPEFSDRVKERYHNDATKEELAAYWKVYVQQFWKHPVTYVDAFLNKCYGYFYPDDPGRTKAWFVVGADISPLNEIGFDLYARFPAAVKQLDRLLEAFRQIPFLGYTSSVGFYTWCTFLSMFFIAQSGKKRLLWLFVPALLVILVCVASPVNAYFRYELPVVFSVPCFLAVTVYAMNGRKKEAKTG